MLETVDAAVGTDAVRGTPQLTRMQVSLDNPFESQELPPPPLGSVALPHRNACSESPSRIMDGVPEVYGLGVTSSQVFVATGADVWTTGRDGGMAREVDVDAFVVRILVDEDQLFWSDNDLGLNRLDAHGESTVFLPSHGYVAGLSQDENSIYATSDGYLVRVSKQTKRVTPLIESTPESSVYGSPTAVDAEWVYFVSSAEDGLRLERVRKDGTERTLLATSLDSTMESIELLVAERHVYVRNHYRMFRVPLEGGTAESLGSVPSPVFSGWSMAQDRSCLYFVADNALLCWQGRHCARTGAVARGWRSPTDHRGRVRPLLRRVRRLPGVRSAELGGPYRLPPGLRAASCRCARFTRSHCACFARIHWGR